MTRTGKSTQAENMAFAAAQSGLGLAVFDPNRDSYISLVNRFAKVLARKPQRIQRIALLDPTDQDWSVGFNPLELRSGEIAERRAGFLADTICKVFQVDPNTVVLMRRVMRNAFQALMEVGLTLVELPPFLRDRGLRERLLLQGVSSHVREFFIKEFPKEEWNTGAWINPTLNRLEILANDPDLRLIFGQQRSTVSWRGIMDAGDVLLANLAKGQLTEDLSRLLGAFLVADIQQAALTRDSLPKHLRRAFFLFLDEFQNYVSPAISTLLEETGKYEVYLFLIHQYLEQLTDERLRAAVLSQCHNLMVFRVSEENAKVLVPKMFHTDLDQVKDVRTRYQSIGGIVREMQEPLYRPLPEVLALEARKLTDLNRYEYWLKGWGKPPMKAKTRFIKDIPSPEAWVQELIDRSGAQVATRRRDAQRMLDERWEKLGLKTAVRTSKPVETVILPTIARRPETKPLPLWARNASRFAFLSPQQVKARPTADDIVAAIDRYGGMLSKSLLCEMFWPDKSERTAEMKLKDWSQEGYLVPFSVKVEPWNEILPEAAWCLDWRGAMLAADTQGLVLPDSIRSNGSRQQGLQQALSQSGFVWLREPPKELAKHDLHLAEIRFAFEKAARSAAVDISEWVYENQWRARSTKGATFPDAVFGLRDKDLGDTAFVVEFDHTTKPQATVVQQLVTDISFLTSPLFQGRFAIEAGRVIGIFESEERMQDICARLAGELGELGSICKMAVLKAVTTRDPLVEAIWWTPGKKQPARLLED